MIISAIFSGCSIIALAAEDVEEDFEASAQTEAESVLKDVRAAHLAAVAAGGQGFAAAGRTKAVPIILLLVFLPLVNPRNSDL